MKKTIVLVLVTLFLAGCSEPVPSELPEDFEVNYYSGAMHIEWGTTKFTANALGEASLVESKELVETTKNFTVTNEELLAIYATATKNNFFSLNELYEDLFIVDGGFSEIELVVNGTRKKVKMINVDNYSFSEVEREIVLLINSKRAVK